MHSCGGDSEALATALFDAIESTKPNETVDFPSTLARSLHHRGKPRRQFRVKSQAASILFFRNPCTQ